MKTRSIYLASFICMIVAGYFVGYRFGPETGDASVISQPGSLKWKVPSFVNSGPRVWKSVNTRILRIVSQETQPLYHPTTLKVDQEANIFVMDWGDLRIKKYSSNGRLLNVVGKGKGSGPGEFLNPLCFDIAANGSIWVCDSETGRLSVFRHDGVLEQTIGTTLIPSRVVALTAGNSIVLGQHGDELFALLDSEGTILRRFGSFVTDQIKNKLILDGWIARNGNDGFVYAPLYASILAGYSSHGREKFIVELVDPVPRPALTVTKQGVYINPATPLVTLSVNRWGEHVYLLNRSASVGRDENASIIDAYNAEDGKYAYSLKIPERSREAYITAQAVYTLADTSITVWKR